METIGTSKVRTFLSYGWSGEPVSNDRIRTDDGFSVENYEALARCVAKLAFYNRDHVLLFRGQSNDHKSMMGLTTIHASMFRKYDGNQWTGELTGRFRRIEEAERLLVRGWQDRRFDEFDRIARHRILRWAILQHYEVCRTPLLDVTQSLQVAASFASIGANEDAFLYVLAVPQLSGAITASAEAGLQIVRLSSICPPSALRPHFQEGYLMTEYPEILTIDEKQRYPLEEIDCARRLLAKFRLRLADGFWRDRDFPHVNERALYPDKHNGDPLARLANEIRHQLGN